MSATQSDRIHRFSDPATERALWWRAVLGEYPTGVSLITGRAGEEPIAIVVGTFTAISQDPPLIGFFVDRSSSTFPRIAATGGFSASVLGSRHEALSRAVATKDPHRFAGVEFAEATSGRPHLSDAVAWFDASIERITEVGDHDLVVGAVTEFGIGNADSGLPLLFRRAGYGSFAAPTKPYDMRAFVERMGWVTAAAPELQTLAAELGTTVTVNTQLGDAVVTVGVFAADPAEPDLSRVGISFPFVAPIAPIFVAWAPESNRHGWLEGSRHLVGRVERDLAARQLESVRRRGYGIVWRADGRSRFDELVCDADRATLARVWDEILAHASRLERHEDDAWQQVSGLQVPVFRGADVVLGLNVSDLPPQHDRDALDAIVARVTATAQAVAGDLAD